MPHEGRLLPQHALLLLLRGPRGVRHVAVLLLLPVAAAAGGPSSGSCDGPHADLPRLAGLGPLSAVRRDDHGAGGHVQRLADGVGPMGSAPAFTGRRRTN